MRRSPASSSGPSTCPRDAESAGGPIAAAAAGVVRAYQLLARPLLPASCRFAPSCSTYAVEAFRRHGLLNGGALAARRIARCHPWSPGGWDPVPPRRG